MKCEFDLLKYQQISNLCFLPSLEVVEKNCLGDPRIYDSIHDLENAQNVAIDAFLLGVIAGKRLARQRKKA